LWVNRALEARRAAPDEEAMAQVPVAVNRSVVSIDRVSQAAGISRRTKTGADAGRVELAVFKIFQPEVCAKLGQIEGTIGRAKIRRRPIVCSASCRYRVSSEIELAIYIH